MMNKFAIVFLTAAMTLGSGAAMAADSGDSNGTSNQAADAGAVSGGAKQNLPPNNVDNSKINNSGTSNTTTKSTHKTMKHHKKMTANEIDQNTQCKDGKCPNVNKKVGADADTKTDGTTN
ncbi:YbgS-like family protein [Erwinia sp. 9145]|uniref:YbgS-like family protein n=1 Tax=Erwinia sp. 9145 TaxID=1500895 RepID=UPI00055071BE|nr:YbgS-like family protein [Erwinia sp. 9145]